MTRILDINTQHKLMLVADQQLSNIRYEPLAEGAVAEDELFFVHLKQAHYCAQHITQGLYVVRRYPEVTGWQRWDEAAKHWERR